MVTSAEAMDVLVSRINRTLGLGKKRNGAENEVRSDSDSDRTLLEELSALLEAL